MLMVPPGGLESAANQRAPIYIYKYIFTYAGEELQRLTDRNCMGCDEVQSICTSAQLGCSETAAVCKILIQIEAVGGLISSKGNSFRVQLRTGDHAKPRLL